MTQQFFNNFDTTLSVQVEVPDLTMTVDDATGLPVTLGGGNNYRLTLSDGPVETLWEIVDVVVDRAGNVITMVRAQEGTTALVWPIGTFVSARNTAETMDGAVGGGGGGGDGSAIVQSREIGILVQEVNGSDTFLGYSQDGGLSWNGDGRSGFQDLAGGSPVLPVFAVGVGQAGMDTAVCIAENEEIQVIDFSKDGGKNWIRVADFSESAGQVALIAYDGVDTYVIICSSLAGTDDDGLFRSTDNGVSFSRVTGITGFDWLNEGMVECQYGTGSKLWGVVNDSVGDGKIISSSDDGSTWSVERDVAADDDWVMAHSSTGVMFFEATAFEPDMIFDADGVSLPAPTTNPIGVGTSARLFNGEPDSVFADPNSDFPGRVFVTIDDQGNNEIIVFRTDDDGATWKEWITPRGVALPSAGATAMKFGWDGEHYHAILTTITPSQDVWLRSRDGVVWMPSPLSLDSLPGNQSARIAFFDKPA